MATVVVQQQPVRHSTPDPLTPALSLNASPRTSSPIPNKHIPICPPGPAPNSLPRLPDSPTLRHEGGRQTTSLLYPPDSSTRISKSPSIYSIDAKTLAAAREHLATQILPDPKVVFPWLHGLHPDNHIQVAFFLARRRQLRRTPRCLRALTIVKAGGDLSRSRLKEAITPNEILCTGTPRFLESDPPEGFSVRNFHIQTRKLAAVSDIVVYGEDETSKDEVLAVAEKIAMAQKEWRSRYDSISEPILFNTFVLSSSFQDVEDDYPELVAVDSEGQMTGQVMDFFQWERWEMCEMSKASEISPNVFLGPTPEYFPVVSEEVDEEQDFHLYIETNDVATMPDPRYLSRISANLNKEPQRVEFPSSGSIIPESWSPTEASYLIHMCQWIYSIVNDEKGDKPSSDVSDDRSLVKLKTNGRKVLIHCGDGYTESSLLAIAYFMFAEGVPAHEAWLRLHREKKRNFFAYPTDVTFLTSIQQQLLQESPAFRGTRVFAQPEPSWMSKMDGSLPSRVLPYMYLGNLTHANNPELLRALGIRRILSIGEPVSWQASELEDWGYDNLMMIDQVQDNGIDPLTQEFDRCLKFIEKGKADGSATLVHCRVGVSRSATICIAEVMSSLGLSFPRAYCFVRARRLNVIIQPHLRFVYELLKWEEFLLLKRGKPVRRELEWATIAREIALMNKPYSRQ